MKKVKLNLKHTLSPLTLTIILNNLFNFIIVLKGILKNEIEKLNNHIKFIKESNKRYASATQVSNAYFEDMDKILTIIKRNPIFNSGKNTLTYGSKVIVIGKPYHIRNNRIVVYANGIYPDNGVNRDFEIYFKRHLIELYQNIYYKYTLDGELIDKDKENGRFK